MLASVFVSQGVKAVTDPSSTRAQAEQMRDRIAPLLSRVAPASVAGMVPEDTTTWARLRGVAQIIAGIGLSTGLGRRGSALVLAACNVQDMLAGGFGPKALKDPQALGRIALTGGLLLAAQDTEGHPGLGYRAHVASAQVQKKGKKAAKSLESAQADAQKAAKKALRRTGKKAQRALAS
jgi:uncharacterized membrane protein YphA (DoxX/SURF4 family)